VVGFCENCVELQVYIKWRFLDQMSEYKLFEKYPKIVVKLKYLERTVNPV
jgi:hypothetical protein